MPVDVLLNDLLGVEVLAVAHALQRGGLEHGHAERKNIAFCGLLNWPLLPLLQGLEQNWGQLAAFLADAH